MTDYGRIEKILRALASKSRLQILECIQNGVANPGDMAKELKRHRSTIEKHLKVLLVADIVQKIPALNTSGQLTIRYDIHDSMKSLLARIQEAIE
jgi:DNA-binding transcriptional ArsR family regulator